MYAKPSRTLRRMLRSIRNGVGRDMDMAGEDGPLLDDVRRDQEKFEEWRRLNPHKTFKEFSAEQIEATLKEGILHPSLGAKLRSGPYEMAGIGFYKTLLTYGLNGSDTCVDYGCGTLRVGQHVVRYLGRRCYWGLDISPRLLEHGQALVGRNVMSEKEPQLRVISTESVLEAAKAKPKTLFSHRVLPHVHPDELAEYFRNIMTIINSNGQAIIDGKWSDQETVQYKPGSWAHSESAINALASSMDGRITKLIEKRQDVPSQPRRRGRKGIFRLVHKSNTNAYPIG